MKFQAGMPRPANAGRKKGSPNKKTQELHAMCEKEGLNVFEAMIKMAKDTHDPIAKFQMLKELAQYLYAKRKAVEVSADEQSGFKIIITDYTKG